MDRMNLVIAWVVVVVCSNHSLGDRVRVEKVAVGIRLNPVGI